MNIKSITKRGMDSPDSREGTVAAVVNTAGEGTVAAVVNTAGEATVAAVVNTAGEGTVAAFVNTAVFSAYMKGGEFFNHLKDYLIFTQDYTQSR
jgi:bifunctional pyridoxal-dependent enzyme with beta-cystathionase and maltose regulon repressor activities